MLPTNAARHCSAVAPLVSLYPRPVPRLQAYFYGFWKAKRIVLYDTLISQNTEPQVLAVLGTTQAHLHTRAALLGWPAAALCP